MTALSPVLFVAPVRFARLKQRHQAFAVELAQRGFDVMFLEPFLGNGWSMTAEPVNERLQVFKIGVPFKAASFPGLQQICVRLGYAILRRKTGLKPSECLLWLAEPSMAAIAAHDWKAVVYDRCDLHGDFPGQRRRAWQKYEDYLVSRADLISISHPFLASDLPGSAAAKTVLAPNACSAAFIGDSKRPDPGIFRSATQQQSNVKIRLVSSGAHYEWVDCAWLSMLSQLDGVELHIAGTGRGQDFAKLLGGSNVVNHGHLDHPRLLELLLSCQVGLIPFKDIKLINGVDPIKAYEYAACGLEVWAPDLKPLRANQLIGRFINSRAQAEKALSLHKNSPVLFNGQVPLWGERMQTILDRLAVLRSD